MHVIYNYNNWWRWAPKEGPLTGGRPNQKVTFDGPNKIIYVAPEIEVLDVKEDLYSAWKEWVIFSPEAPRPPIYPEAISVIGGEEISSDTSVGATFFLENGWRIQPYVDVKAYTLTINGNLYTREVGDNPFLFAQGVSVSLTRSNIVDLIRVESLTANITEVDLAAITARVAPAVWEEQVVNHVNPGTTGKKLKDNLTQTKYIARI